MIFVILCIVLAVAATTASVISSQPYHEIDVVNPISNRTINQFFLSTLPQTSQLNRRIIHDGTCPENTVQELTQLMTRIARIARLGIGGAMPGRPTRGGRRGGRGRGRGGGPDDAATLEAKEGFERAFGERGTVGRLANIPLTPRIYIRRLLDVVAEQASQIGGLRDRTTRGDQVYHCEFEVAGPYRLCRESEPFLLMFEPPRWNVLVSRPLAR